jgi:hypothetical protein
MNWSKHTPLRVIAACGLGFLAMSCGTGCQVQVGGQTLPSGYYLDDDVQYFPEGPEFILSREAAAMEEFKAEEAQRRLGAAR